MFQQPIVIDATAPTRKRRRYTKKYAKKFKSYKRKSTAASRYRRYLQKMAGPRGSDGSKALWGASWKEANPDQRAARAGLGFKGLGDYSNNRFSLFDFGGAFSGNTASVKTGNNKITGLGEYTAESVGGNQIMQGYPVSMPMTVNGTTDNTDDIYVSHREFIGNVQAQATIPGGGTTGYSNFSLQEFDINAAIAKSFPWLSQIAQNFTLYEFQGLIYEYVPTSGEFGTTGTNALGKLIMGTQYDPDASNWLSSVQMENYSYARACKPSEHMMHGVETAPNERAPHMLYLRTGATAKDKILTDIGKFQIATEGIPLQGAPGSTVTSNIGELWVSYRCKLSRAQLFGSVLANNVMQDNFIGLAAGTNPFGASVTNYQVLLGTAANKYDITTAVSLAKVRNTNTIGGALEAVSQATLKYIFPTNIVSGLYRIRFWHRIGQPTVGNTVEYGTAAIPLFITVENGIQALPSGMLPGNVMLWSRADNDGIAGHVNDSFGVEVYVQVSAPGYLQASVQLSAQTTNALGVTTFYGFLAGDQTFCDVIQVPQILTN